MQVITKSAGWFILLFTLSLLISCGQGKRGNEKQDPAAYRESLLKANQEAVRVENEQIDDYIIRHNLKMEKTETGIRMMIIKQGIGAKAETGKTVKLSYTVTLLTGDTIYSAYEDGPLIFEVGKGQVITGLEEAILLLRVGDRAKFIIPSHLAFGLIGDQKKILHKATLVYDMEFISMY
jgi:FKBP-type peptidyl-prolyl cis-trans isomerase FkpA